MTTATATVTWRKTKTGEWVVCGLASELRQAAKTCTALPVTSRAGATKWVQVTRVGKTFGDGLAYGYIATTAPHRTAHVSSGSCDNCGERAGRHERTDSSGIGGLVCGMCNREPHYALSFA